MAPNEIQASNSKRSKMLVVGSTWFAVGVIVRIDGPAKSSKAGIGKVSIHCADATTSATQTCAGNL